GYLTGHLSSLELSPTIPTDMLLVMLVSVAIVTVGIGLGWWLYGRKPAEKAAQPDPLEQIEPEVFSFLGAKFLIDELYDATVVRLNAGCARASRWLDQFVWNGLVQVVSYLVVGLSWLNRLLDEFVVNLGFDKGCGSLRTSGKIFSGLQNGQVQRYLRVIGLALVISALIFIWGCRS